MDRLAITDKDHRGATELGHMFVQVEIILLVYIVPENTKTKTTYGYWVVRQCKDD